jgi:hypothetical protein
MNYCSLFFFLWRLLSQHAKYLISSATMSIVKTSNNQKKKEKKKTSIIKNRSERYVIHLLIQGVKWRIIINYVFIILYIGYSEC